MMYGFEDSVGVDLRLDSQGGSYSVTGRGCDVWSGLFPPTPFSSDDSQRACGELGGQGVGPSLEFSFTFPSSIPPGGDVTYASSVQASKDGTRMAGSLTTGMAGRLGGPARRGYGWIRLADIGIDDGWNGYDPPRGPSADLGPFPVGANIELLLALQGDAPVGALLPGQTYVEKLDAGGSTVAWLAGDLGAYWNPDFHWDEATRTYTAGPVPETLPGFPVKLELHLNASDLGVRDAVVTMADGATGTLLPASP
jgi:hypothetical protein